MPVLIEVAGLVARVVVVRPRLLRHALVAMPMLIEVAWRVARVIMVLTRNLLHARVPMPVRIEIAGLVAGMVVVWSWLFLLHGFPRLTFYLLVDVAP